MKKKRSKKWVVLLLLLLLALGTAGGYYVWKQMTPTDTETEHQKAVENRNTKEVSRGSIRMMTEGNGSIEPAEEITVTAEYSVKAEKVLVENGDIIHSGDVIAVLDEESIQQQMDLIRTQMMETETKLKNMDRSGSSSLTAPLSGRVKRIFVQSGDVLTDVVKQYGGIMELSADGRLKVEFTSQQPLKLGEVLTIQFSDYSVEGTLLSCEKDVYTVTFEDSADYSVDTNATICDAEGHTLGSGVILSSHPYLVGASYGVCDEIHVDVNDYVYSGNSLLSRIRTDYNQDYLDMLDQRKDLVDKLQELQELKDAPQILASGDGILSNLTLTDGMMMTEDMAIYHLISTEHFWLKAEIDELDIAQVQAGQQADIVFDAFDDETYAGSVEKVSALGQNTGGVTKYTVTISVPGIEKVKTAMSATARIIIAEKENVLLIPVDAVSTVDGKKCVTVIRNGQDEVQEVQLGLVNNTEAEVMSGLAEGENVLLPEQSDMEWMINMMRQGRNSSREGGK